MTRWSERCIELRAIRGWSQVELAAALGVSEASVQNWERGTYRPQLLVRPVLKALWKKAKEEAAAGTAPKPPLSKRGGGRVRVAVVPEIDAPNVVVEEEEAAVVYPEGDGDD